MELISLSPREPLLLGGVLHHELLGLALLPLKYDPGVFFGFSIVGVSSRDTNFVFFQPERKQTKSIIPALLGTRSLPNHTQQNWNFNIPPATGLTGLLIEVQVVIVCAS